MQKSCAEWTDGVGLGVMFTNIFQSVSTPLKRAVHASSTTTLCIWNITHVPTGAIVTRTRGSSDKCVSRISYVYGITRGIAYYILYPEKVIQCYYTLLF